MKSERPCKSYLMNKYSTLYPDLHFEIVSHRPMKTTYVPVGGDCFEQFETKRTDYKSETWPLVTKRTDYKSETWPLLSDFYVVNLIALRLRLTNDGVVLYLLVS